MTWRLLCATAVSCIIAIAGASAEPLGQFTDHQDIGKPRHAGSATYDAKTKTYRVTGGGQNMWAARDDFHYVWKKMSGDVRATTDLVFVSPEPAPNAPGYLHRKGGIVLRQNLDTDSAYVDVLRMGNKQLSLQYRETKGGQTHLIWINTDRQNTVRLEKIGDYVYLYIPGPDGTLRPAGGAFKLKINGPSYIGLGVCPHDDAITETMDFANISIVALTAAASGAQTTLQTMQAGNPWEQTAVVNAAGQIETPTWSADGKSFIYRNKGQTFRVSAEGGEPEKAAGATLRSGDSVSADRHWVYFSDKGKLWRAHADGSGREQITSNADTRDWSPHPSPDGKWLVYASAAADAPAAKNGDIEIRLIPVADGVPRTGEMKIMAKTFGGARSLDLQPWSPDSKNFAFVSSRPR